MLFFRLTFILCPKKSFIISVQKRVLSVQLPVKFSIVGVKYLWFSWTKPQSRCCHVELAPEVAFSAEFCSVNWNCTKSWKKVTNINIWSNLWIKSDKKVFKVFCKIFQLFIFWTWNQAGDLSLLILIYRFNILQKHGED